MYVQPSPAQLFITGQIRSLEWGLISQETVTRFHTSLQCNHTQLLPYYV